MPSAPVALVLIFGIVIPHSVPAQETGLLTVVAGSGPRGFSGDGGDARGARLNHPLGVTVDAAGRLFIADSASGRIRRVSPDGRIATVAGRGSSTLEGDFSGDGGPAPWASFERPGCIVADSAGRLFVGDAGSRRIRRIDPDGIVNSSAWLEMIPPHGF